MKALNKQLLAKQEEKQEERGSCQPLPAKEVKEMEIKWNLLL